jgi:hypothetical protein
VDQVLTKKYLDTLGGRGIILENVCLSTQVAVSQGFALARAYADWN